MSVQASAMGVPAIPHPYDPHRGTKGNPTGTPCGPHPHDHTVNCPPFGFLIDQPGHITIDRRPIRRRRRITWTTTGWRYT